QQVPHVGVMIVGTWEGEQVMKTLSDSSGNNWRTITDQPGTTGGHNQFFDTPDVPNVATDGTTLVTITINTTPAAPGLYNFRSVDHPVGLVLDAISRLNGQQTSTSATLATCSI